MEVIRDLHAPTRLRRSRFDHDPFIRGYLQRSREGDEGPGAHDQRHRLRVSHLKQLKMFFQRSQRQRSRGFPKLVALGRTTLLEKSERFPRK